MVLFDIQRCHGWEPYEMIFLFNYFSLPRSAEPAGCMEPTSIPRPAINEDTLMSLMPLSSGDHVDGRVVKGWPRSQRALVLAPIKTTDFLTNSCGQAINALVPLFTKKCK